MDITPFYELKNRLYASVAAGCCSISEDFRLKRAVESFEPLSKVNKAFLKLYDMCVSLINSEFPSSEISDCIALADALAVTQGVCKDNSENESAVKSDTSCAKIPYSELEILCADIRKNGAELWQLSKDKACFIKDPRVLQALLFNLENGKETTEFKLSMNIVCQIYGDSIADILKDSVETSGKQIKYVKNLRGDKENDWYISLYENTENSENVRKEAVVALSCSENNTEKLLEIYKTEKGKIKNAAVMALAKLSPKEADPIFAKMAEKYKDSYEEYFSESSGEVCTKFIIDRIMGKFGNGKMSGSGSTSDHPPQLYPRTIENLLQNKTGENADNAYLVLRGSVKERLKAYTDLNLTAALNYSLIHTLCNPKKREEAKAQITRLYERDSKYFMQAKTFLDITENPDAPIQFDPDTRDAIFMVIHQIYYVPILDQYFLQPIFLPYRSVLSTIDFPVGERFPKSMLDFIVTISEYVIEDLREMENSEDEGMLKIPENGKFSRKGTINQKFMNAKTIAGNVLDLLKELIRVCGPSDYDMLKNTMKTLAIKFCEVCGHALALSVVSEYCYELLADEKIRLYSAYILNNLKYMGTAFTALYGITDFAPDQLKAVRYLEAEFNKLKEKAKAKNWLISEDGFSRQERSIRDTIQDLEKQR